MAFCLLGSRPIDPKQRIKIFKHRESKILGKFLEHDVFLECAVCLAKANHIVLNKYTKVGKRCFNLNPGANYRPQGALADRAEKGVCLSIYLFTEIPVTIYSTIELSNSVIVLGHPLKFEG